MSPRRLQADTYSRFIWTFAGQSTVRLCNSGSDTVVSSCSSLRKASVAGPVMPGRTDRTMRSSPVS